MKLVPPFLLLWVMATCSLILQHSSSLHGQAPEKSVSSSPIPAWPIAAGGSAKFDVASVKQNRAGANAALAPSQTRSNVSLDPEDLFTPTGGLFSAIGFPISNFMLFAYKLTAAQYFPLPSQLPKWANTNLYDIEARARGNPTKDEYRLMVQALLADRFKLPFTLRLGSFR